MTSISIFIHNSDAKKIKINNFNNKIIDKRNANSNSLLNYGYKLINNKANLEISGYINGIPYIDIENNCLYNISNVIQVSSFNGLKFIVNSDKNYVNVYYQDTKHSNIIKKLKNKENLNVIGVIYDKWYLISFGQNKYIAKEGFIAMNDVKISYYK